MRTKLALALSVVAVAGIACAPAAVAAAPGHAPRTGAASSAQRRADPDTIVTFTVTSGLLTLSAPGTASLGSGRPGSTITGTLGTCTVTDERALTNATWTVVASSTAYTTGAGTPAETIAASAVDYDPGEVTTTGVITVTTTIITFSGTPQQVLNGTAGSGNNSATWDPTILVDVPGTAVGGRYTGTITQSVS